MASRSTCVLWPFLGRLAERLPGGWLLIGGQMVLLHGMEHGQLPLRETNDADALVDVRVAPRGTAELASALTDMGFELEGINTDGVGHRFVGHGLAVDLLAPDHLGERATLTTIPPARTVRVPAGTRLLHAPRRCPVAVAGQLHSSVQITLDRYSHIMPHMAAALAERMDAAYCAVEPSTAPSDAGDAPVVRLPADAGRPTSLRAGRPEGAQ